MGRGRRAADLSDSFFALHDANANPGDVDCPTDQQTPVQPVGGANDRCQSGGDEENVTDGGGGGAQDECDACPSAAADASENSPRVSSSRFIAISADGWSNGAAPAAGVIERNCSAARPAVRAQCDAMRLSELPSEVHRVGKPAFARKLDGRPALPQQAARPPKAQLATGSSAGGGQTAWQARALVIEHPRSMPVTKERPDPLCRLVAGSDRPGGVSQDPRRRSTLRSRPAAGRLDVRMAAWTVGRHPIATDCLDPALYRQPVSKQRLHWRTRA